MAAKMGPKCALPVERRHLCKRFKAEVAPLELAFAEVSPFSERDRLAVLREQGQRVTMDEILRQDVRGGKVRIICFSQIQVVSKDLEHIGAAFSDIVRQELNSVSTHDRQQGVVPPFKV